MDLGGHWAEKGSDEGSEGKMTGVKGRPTVLLAESDASAPTPYLALPYLTLPVVKVRGREAQPSAPI